MLPPLYAQDKDASGRQRLAFTLVETLISVAVVAVLLVLVFPAFGAMRKQAHAVKCLGNTRVYGTAILTCLADRGALPPGESNEEWSAVNYRTLLVPKYLPNVLRCPLATDADPNKQFFHYAGNRSLNRYYPKILDVPAPLSRVVLAVELYYWDGFHAQGHLKRTIFGTDDGSDDPSIKPQYHGTRDRRGLHFFFADGHVKLVTAVDNNWSKEPLKGNATNGGYFYLSEQFMSMKNGNLIIQ